MGWSIALLMLLCPVLAVTQISAELRPELCRYPICVQGYLREYRKEDDTGSPYRAIVASDFSTRKDRERTQRGPAPGATASGYTEVDPVPDY